NELRSSYADRIRHSDYNRAWDGYATTGPWQTEASSQLSGGLPELQRHKNAGGP
ncbi:hypothetical protein M9458_011090, partial [Cirrhinus mrigala]